MGLNNAMIMARSAPDCFLTLFPETSYFQTEHIQHTAFSMAPIEQQFLGQQGFGQELIADISSPGDILWQTYVVFDRPALLPGEGEYTECNAMAYWVNAFGYTVIQTVELRIGNITAAQSWGEFMECWEDLSGGPGKRLHEMIAKRYTVYMLMLESQRPKRLYSPLSMFFCGSPALGLRTIGLAFTSISFKVTLRAEQDMWITNQVACNAGDPQAREVPPKVNGFLAVRLLIIYFWLDGPERADLNQKTDEVVITQTQISMGQNAMTTGQNGFNRVQLIFTLPVKELIFLVQNTALVNGRGLYKQWDNYSGPNGSDPIQWVTLQIASDNQGNPQMGSYHRLCVPWRYHTNIPELWIYVMVFCIYPEIEASSGSMNFSRLDNVYFNLMLVPGGNCNAAGAIVFAFRCYAQIINVFRYTGGQGGPIWQV